MKIVQRAQLNKQKRIARFVTFQSDLRITVAVDTMSLGMPMVEFTVPTALQASTFATSGNLPFIWRINIKSMLNSRATGAIMPTVIIGNSAMDVIMHIIITARKCNTKIIV